MTKTMTPQQILDLPMGDNDSGQATIRGYLVALLHQVFTHGEDFSGKRPFGNSGWDDDLELVRAGLVEGSIDQDDGVAVANYETADALILGAILSMGETTGTAVELKQRPGDQPLPVVNDHPDIQSQVIADIEARRQVGIGRYGSALQPLNGRDTLLDAYEEFMDLTIYLRSVLTERDDVEGVAAIQRRLRETTTDRDRLQRLVEEFALQFAPVLDEFEQESADDDLLPYARATLDMDVLEKLRTLIGRLT